MFTDTDTPFFKLCESYLSVYHSSGIFAGIALAAIKDLGMLGVFEDFEAYCSERWDIRKSQAYRLIDSAGVFSDLSGLSFVELLEIPQIGENLIPQIGENLIPQIGENLIPQIGENSFPQFGEKILPKNESQCRPLVKLLKNHRLACWDRVLELHSQGRRLSQSLVQQVVDEFLGADTGAAFVSPDFLAEHPPRPYILPHIVGRDYFGTFNAVIDIVSPGLKDHTAAFVYIAILRSAINGICKISDSALSEKCSVSEKTLAAKVELLKSRMFFDLDEQQGHEKIYRLYDLDWVLEANGWTPSKPAKQTKAQKQDLLQQFRALWTAKSSELSKVIHYQLVPRVRVLEKSGRMLLKVSHVSEQKALLDARDKLQDILGFNILVEVG